MSSSFNIIEKNTCKTTIIRTQTEHGEKKDDALIFRSTRDNVMNNLDKISW